jgi:hypothetical protein
MRSAYAPSACKSEDGPLHSWIALSIGLAAIGHLVWEAAQLPLYTLWRTGTRREIAFALFHCAGGDILITIATFAAAVALARAFRCPPFGWRMVFTAIMLSAAYTILSEWLNVQIRRTWSYTAAMPVIPFLGTGLMPLMQWLIVPSLALAIIGYRYRRAHRIERCRDPASP